jgi:hypothetical protein
VPQPFTPATCSARSWPRGLVDARGPAAEPAAVAALLEGRRVLSLDNVKLSVAAAGRIDGALLSAHARGQ